MTGAPGAGTPDEATLGRLTPEWAEVVMEALAEGEPGIVARVIRVSFAPTPASYTEGETGQRIGSEETIPAATVYLDQTGPGATLRTIDPEEIAIARLVVGADPEGPGMEKMAR